MHAEVPPKKSGGTVFSAKAAVMMVSVLIALAYLCWIFIQTPCDNKRFQAGCLFTLVIIALFVVQLIWLIIAEYVFWRKKPERIRQEQKVLLWLTPLLFLGALAMLPNVQLKAKAYNASARSAGYNAKIAQELYYQNGGGDEGGIYPDNLEKLLYWDKNLTDDPCVTFVFGTCNNSGYTYTTHHACDNEDRVNVFTD